METRELSFYDLKMWMMARLYVEGQRIATFNGRTPITAKYYEER